MKKYTLYMWPDSQEFIGNPLCFLVSPPEDETDPTRLDSSYMVPVTLAEPAEAEKVYIKLDVIESKIWEDKTDDEDNVLFDYDGHAFVEESLYKSETGKKKGLTKASYDVCFSPMTCVDAMVKDPLNLTEEEEAEIIRKARENILASGDDYICADNVESIDKYDARTGMKTPVFSARPESIDQKLKAIMDLKPLVGEFSVDLYYNNWDNENPYTAKLHSVLYRDFCFHARAKGFDEALEMILDYLKKNHNI